jgi:hypothetical protein
MFLKRSWAYLSGRAASTALFTGALAVRLVLAPFFDFCFDDAYITFRVARNLARGLGMVFNQGERVLVTSTPLYTFLMAPGELLGLGAPLWSRLLNSAASAAVCLLAYTLLRGRVRRGLLVFVTVSLALSPFSIFMTLTGMESPVVALLLLLATYLYREGRAVRLGLVLGACFLVRPEGALAAVLFSLAVLVHRRRLSIRVMAPLAAIAAGWLAVSISFFGSPIPNSLVAKQAYFGVRHFSVLFNAQDMTWLLWATIPLFPLLILFLPAGLLSAVRGRREFLPLAAWLLIVLAGQLLMGFNLPWWYLDQVTAPLFILLALGAERFLSSRGGRRPAALLVRRPAVIAAGLASVISCVFMLRVLWVEYLDIRTNVLTMSRVANWFIVHDIPRERSIGVEAIGRIGYETDLRILDTFGLASPEMIPLIEAGKMSDEEIMRLLMPDYYITGATLKHESMNGYRLAGRVLSPQLLRPVVSGLWTSEPAYCQIYRAPGVEPAAGEHPLPPPAATQHVDGTGDHSHDGQR